MPSEMRALSLEVCYHFSGNSTVLAGKVVHKCPQTSEWSQGCLSLSVFLPNPTQPPLWKCDTPNYHCPVFS